jgi:uncharacterized protein (TIGR02145 family)
MSLRVILLALFPYLCLGQIASPVQEVLSNKIINEGGDLEKQRRSPFNLEEIKVRWKKAALENCPGVPCVTISIPTLSTTTISSITATGAAGGGNITSDGGAAVTARGVVWNTSSAPTVSLSTKTTDGSGTGTFTSTLASLTASTTYYVRAYATNSVGTAYGNEVTFTTSAPAFTCGTSTITDFDGNTYNTVSIGTQCWTKENLKVTKYNDGTAIPEVADNGTWAGLTTGARAAYDNNISNVATYGYLYNWYAASGIVTSGGSSTKNICPTGWHVPTDAEWTTLTDFLGGLTVAGGKMKETGTLWNDPNTGATNESGFSARPGGFRFNFGGFLNSRFNAVFWSATENGVGLAWGRNLNYNNGQVVRSSDSKRNGLSVRCLRD